jgi:hypothetical protein
LQEKPPVGKNTGQERPILFRSGQSSHLAFGAGAYGGFPVHFHCVEREMLQQKCGAIASPAALIVSPDGGGGLGGVLMQLRG